MVALPQPVWEKIVAELAAVRTLLEAREARTIPDRPMSPAEVAKITGRSEKTVRRWIGRGKLRAKHEGRTMLVRPVDLQRFLDGGSGR
ncbi:MAG: helix-turn-helix domain-containing protein [Chthoniobacteraceae bacterium]